MGSLDYWLDAEDRILRVSDSWDSFAVENGGSGAREQFISGRVLWDFIGNDEVRRYLNAVFFAVRKWGHPITLPVRCDSPDEARHLDMTVAPLANGGLHVAHQQNANRVFAHGAATPPGDARCVVCSTPQPQAAGTQAMIETRAGDTVCGPCRRHAADTIAQVRTNWDGGQPILSLARARTVGQRG